MSLTNSDRQFLINFIKEKKLSINTHTSWENFSRNLKQDDALVLDIENIADLQTIVREIYDINEKKLPLERIILRTAAGDPNKKSAESYSFTPGAVADIIIRLVGKDFNEVKSTTTPNVVNVGASVQIGELEELLYDKFDLSLPTSSLIPYVTVAGLSANSGHGTGKDQPSFAGLIQAMTLCLPNGEIVRIDKNDEDFAAIRAAHLGLFGIVLNVELECMPACKMQCIMEARSVPEFLKEVEEGLFLNNPYVSVMYVPTYTQDEITNNKYKNVLISRWQPVSKNTDDVNVHPKWSRIIQEIEVKLEEGFHVSDLLRCVPGLIPYYMRYLVTRFVVGNKDSLSIGPWPLTHHQTSFPRNIVDTDMLFSVSKDTHEVADAFKKMIEQLNVMSKKQQYPITYAAYMRLFKGTAGGLSTSSSTKDYICGFDMVTAPRIPGAKYFDQAMTDYFLNDLKAKPHWGKFLPQGVDYKTLYGESYQEFEKTLQGWYQKFNMQLSHSMLLNKFTSDILGMPFPHVAEKISNKNSILQTSLSPSLMAEKLLPYVDGQDIYAQRLRHQLRIVMNKPTFKNNSIFYKQSTLAPAQLPELLNFSEFKK